MFQFKTGDFQQFDVFISSDNISFTEVLSDQSLNRPLESSGSVPAGNEPPQTKSLFTSPVRYIRLDIDSTFEGSSSDWQGGFSKVRFEGY